MAKQNIFDNEIFFEGYKTIRDKEGNANDLFEIPAIFSLLPDLKGKSVLDLGCGFGEHCVEFINKGASRVVGIDISEKMLGVARKENSHPAISYMLLPIEDIEKVEGKFDVVISSLALHYVEDFEGVVKKIHNKLNANGYFIFSQEPIYHSGTSCSLIICLYSSQFFSFPPATFPLRTDSIILNDLFGSIPFFIR